MRDRREYMRQWRKDHPEYNRLYRLQNRKRILEQRRQRYLKNKERISEYNRLWRLKNKEHINERKRQRRLKMKKDFNEALSKMVTVRDALLFPQTPPLSDKEMVSQLSEALQLLHAYKWIKA